MSLSSNWFRKTGFQLVNRSSSLRRDTNSYMIDMENIGIPNIWVGMPTVFKLQDFGSQVWAAFGEPPYLVGSATYKRDWRDVDVRLMLPDDRYKEMFGRVDHASINGKWVAMCWAFSALGKDMTGLPVDFQIQAQSDADKQYPKDKENHLINARIPLGLIPLRYQKDG